MSIYILKIIFITISAIFSILLITAHIMFIKNLRNILSKCTPAIAIFLILYFIICICFVPIVNGLINKLIMLLFALLPFIIGQVVSYKKLKIYSIIQIFCVILSIIFVIMLG